MEYKFLVNCTNDKLLKLEVCKANLEGDNKNESKLTMYVLGLELETVCML